jgi:hypothetical protein
MSICLTCSPTKVVIDFEQAIQSVVRMRVLTLTFALYTDNGANFDTRAYFTTECLRLETYLKLT